MALSEVEGPKDNGSEGSALLTLPEHSRRKGCPTKIFTTHFLCLSGPQTWQANSSAYLPSTEFVFGIPTKRKKITLDLFAGIAILCLLF
jgi:hypothetical protein